MQTLAIAQHVHHLACPGLLGAAERFLFKRGDAPGFVARRRVFVNRLVVGDKVLFEVVHHGDGFLKRRFITAVAHQNTLRAEHLRYFGQHRGAAVGNHVVGETPQHRVGSDTGQAVRAAALQPKLQLAEFTRLASVMTHRLIQRVEMLKARLHFIVLVLANHKMHARRVESAQRVAKRVHLIVLTAQTNHQHRPGIRVTHHVLQHGAGIDVVVAKLRTAIGMAEEKYAVDVFGVVCFFKETVLDLPRDAVDAAHGRQDPEFVANAHFAACAAVDLHLAVAHLLAGVGRFGLIAILVQIAEIGAGIMGVNMFAWRDIRQRMAYRQAIFNDVLSLRDGQQRKLMPARHRLEQHDGDPVNDDDRAFGQIRQRYRNVILRMDPDVLHINLKGP
ncbi:hypothetical protein BN135_2989 [Cronobacter muytjensii 530]